MTRDSANREDAGDPGDAAGRTDFYRGWLDDTKTNPLARTGSGPLHKVIKSDEMPWEDSEQGAIKHVINERLAEQLGAPVKCVDIYMQEISPGSKSGKHSHMSEELVFVLDGDGYDLHWDPTAIIEEEYEWQYPEEPQRFDWRQEDVIYIPTGTAHQHHNAGDEPARLLCCQNRVYNHLGYGYNDLVQLESAPDA